MSGNRTIQAAIKNMIEQHTQDTIFYADAIVNSVDTDNRICNCTLIGGKASNTFPNCRLMTDLDDGILIIPTIGSTITIILSSFTDPIVIGYSEVDKIILRGGDLGGLVLVKDLITKLNNIENDVNNIKKIFSTTWNPVPNDGGAALKAAAATWAGQTLTPTKESDIENTAITQG